LKKAFLFILEFMIKRIKNKFNHREWTLAVDSHYEPFYGQHKDIWVHGYKPQDCKDCTGSYCYITIAIVIGEARFTLLALPVHIGQAHDDLIEELIFVAQKHLKIKVILFDRGFHSGAIIKKLHEMKVKYIIFGQRRHNIKK